MTVVDQELQKGKVKDEVTVYAHIPKQPSTMHESGVCLGITRATWGHANFFTPVFTIHAI